MVRKLDKYGKVIPPGESQAEKQYIERYGEPIPVSAPKKDVPAGKSPAELLKFTTAKGDIEFIEKRSTISSRGEPTGAVQHARKIAEEQKPVTKIIGYEDPTKQQSVFFRTPITEQEYETKYRQDQTPPYIKMGEKYIEKQRKEERIREGIGWSVLPKERKPTGIMEADKGIMPGGSVFAPITKKQALTYLFAPGFIGIEKFKQEQLVPRLTYATERFETIGVERWGKGVRPFEEVRLGAGRFGLGAGAFALQPVKTTYEMGKGFLYDPLVKGKMGVPYAFGKEFEKRPYAVGTELILWGGLGKIPKIKTFAKKKIFDYKTAKWQKTLVDPKWTYDAKVGFKESGRTFQTQLKTQFAEKPLTKFTGSEIIQEAQIKARGVQIETAKQMFSETFKRDIIIGKQLKLAEFTHPKGVGYSPQMYFEVQKYKGFAEPKPTLRLKGIGKKGTLGGGYAPLVEIEQPSLLRFAPEKAIKIGKPRFDYITPVFKSKDMLTFAPALALQQEQELDLGLSLKSLTFTEGALALIPKQIVSPIYSLEQITKPLEITIPKTQLILKSKTATIQKYEVSLLPKLALDTTFPTPQKEQPKFIIPKLPTPKFTRLPGPRMELPQLTPRAFRIRSRKDMGFMIKPIKLDIFPVSDLFSKTITELGTRKPATQRKRTKKSKKEFGEFIKYGGLFPTEEMVTGKIKAWKLKL